MRVCGHFEARRTIRHDPNDVAPKGEAGGSIPFWRAKKERHDLRSCLSFLGFAAVKGE